MYDQPSAAELNIQLAAQATPVNYLTVRLSVEVAHVALLFGRRSGLLS